ncbi:aryl-sulfate sulfotransferase [Alloscardovia venturai]|uniref:Aryl-sulfate sulfotransferase n=1 Tax=Alloscardovia venturai TaxID=1769421 RepID=A0ABW2Y3D0_9BIFI
MTDEERVFRSSGTRTHASDFDRIPSSRTTKNLVSRPSVKNKIHRWAIMIAVTLVVVLVAAGGLTYYNARRNSPSNVLAHNIERIYTIGYQNRVHSNLDTKKRSGKYTQDHMLIEANPYGTNSTSLYVYFVTEQPVSVAYTVSTPKVALPNFTRTVTTPAQRLKTHEFQVIGLIPNTENQIDFTITDANGNTTQKRYTYTMGDLQGNEPVQVNVHNLDALDVDGLFAVMPHASGSANFIYLYDTHGILRGEIPTQNNGGTRLIRRDDELYYAISSTQFVAVDKLGYVDKFITMEGRYTLAGDYTFDGDGNLLAIASNGYTIDGSKEVGNYIVRFDHISGKMKMVANLSTILNAYRTTTVKRGIDKNGKSTTSQWNWLGLNSIAMIDNDHLLLSSRETSSLFTLDISDSPSITSIIGPHDLWEDPQYSYLVLSKDGDFPDMAGQSDISITNKTDAGYTLTLFNNNFAYSPSNPGFNWSTAIPTASQRFDATKSETSSFANTYYVDTRNKTYKLVSSVKCAYAPLYGNAQFIKDKLITTATTNGSWSIADTNGSNSVGYQSHVTSSADGRVIESSSSSISTSMSTPSTTLTSQKTMSAKKSTQNSPQTSEKSIPLIYRAYYDTFADFWFAPQS